MLDSTTIHFEGFYALHSKGSVKSHQQEASLQLPSRMTDRTRFFSSVYVDSEEALHKAVEALSRHGRVAFDAEGVNLGRDGPLTIATFLGLDHDSKDGKGPVIYVVDVQELGGHRVFSSELPSFRGMLEDDAISKVTFDCRGDSDALFHQFGVKLSGVLDLQVLDQAVRVHLGETPPQRCPYVTRGGIPYLQGMQRVLDIHLPHATAKKLAAPHSSFDPKAWAKRPLSAPAISYAANDAYIIQILFSRLQQYELSEHLEKGVKRHSQRYEGMFRDRKKAVNRTIEKDFVMEEHPIIASHLLPAGHARMPGRGLGKAVDKWNTVVAQLKVKKADSRVFQDVIFILQHNFWYTDEAYAVLRRLANACPFTPKQRAKIANPPKLRDEFDDDEEYDYGPYDPFDDWR